MKLNLYHNYSLEELLDDPKFLQWVRETTIAEKSLHLEGLSGPLADKIQEAQNIFSAFQQTALPASSLIPDETFADHLQNQMSQQQHKTKRLVFRNRWIAAAGFLLLLSLGSLWWSQSPKASPSLSYSTQYGEWKSLTLPDGTEVKLNANSKLVWEGGQSRKVVLDGEAFFKVNKVAGKRSTFTVHTPDLQVQVLGTRFNVHTQTDKGTEVFLEEGKVNIFTAVDSIKMEPDQVFIYSKNKLQKTTPSAIAPDQQPSWTDGILNLKEQSVEKVFAEVERIFGQPIQCQDSSLLASVKNIALPINDRKTAIRILEEVLQVKFTEQQGILIIK